MAPLSWMISVPVTDVTMMLLCPCTGVHGLLDERFTAAAPVAEIVPAPSKFSCSGPPPRWIWPVMSTSALFILRLESALALVTPDTTHSEKDTTPGTTVKLTGVMATHLENSPAGVLIVRK